MSTEKNETSRKEEGPKKPAKVKWIPASRLESPDAARALDEVRRVRFPSPTGKVGRPRPRPNILGLI